MKTIYFDNCLTSKPAPEVVDTMLPYLREKFHFPKNFVMGGSEITQEIKLFKKNIANSMGAEANEIYLTTGGTSANNIAIKGFLSENAIRGTHIIVSVIDYPDLLANAAFFEKSGFNVTYLQCDDQGFIDLEQLQLSIRHDTILFMTTLANHTVGSIQPIKKIREILDYADHPITLMIDACEAYGRMEIDVNSLGIDMMSISGHKIHGPQGIGALYVRKGVKISQFKHGIARIDQQETGGFSIASIAGLSKAVDLAFGNLKENIAKMTEVRDYLLEKIEATIPSTLLNGPRGDKRISHNLNISFDYIEGEAIMMMLDLSGILVATGSACASQGLKPNYVLMAMGRDHVQSHGSIKFTLSRYNTKEEVDTTVEKLAEIVKELRSRSPLFNEEK